MRRYSGEALLPTVRSDSDLPKAGSAIFHYRTTGFVDEPPDQKTFAEIDPAYGRASYCSLMTIRPSILPASIRWKISLMFSRLSQEK